MQSSFGEVFLGFLIALAAGALIGLEREQSMASHKKRRIGGVRTFPLIALSGALSAFLSQTLGVWLVLGSLLVVGAFLAVFYYQERAREAVTGVTTEVAALITFLLGALALLPDLPLSTGQRYILIVASAGTVMALLSFKAPLHDVVAKVSDEDIFATAKFAILALVVLPLLPNRTVDPLNVLNLFNIGLMIVLIASVSFLGYIAARILGDRRSLAVTGIVGGMVSSTAVTVSLATRARQDPGTINLATVGILAASGTMFVRILIIVAVVDISLVPVLGWPLGAMTILSYGIALSSYLRGRSDLHESEPIRYRNPLELWPALQFGLLYALVIFVSKAAQTMFSDMGLYVSSVLAGTTDVDAITLSVAQFHRHDLSTASAVIAVTLAAFTNTLVKGCIAWWLGSRSLAMRLFPWLVAVLAGGVLALLLV